MPTHIQEKMFHKQFLLQQKMSRSKKTMQQNLIEYFDDNVNYFELSTIIQNIY